MSAPEHHILYERNQWSRGRTREMWKHPAHRVAIDWSAHTALHQEVGIVPVPDRHTWQRFEHLYIPEPGNIQNTIYAMVGALEIASYKANQIDRQVTELTIQALLAQLPFIRRGL